ncbi:MAG TPA: glycosyltransferase family 39 protein [Candidatus Angelobacter sp.]|nr:glycosyltransferase family 39 protein [Candidatus Angelobacter sp.]
MKTLFELARRNWLFFLLVTAAALALRLFFVFRFPHLAGDTWIYGDIAKNWLNHGIYGLTDNGTVRPTLIRLPGYPGFLAGMFAVFGQEHYRAVMIAQALIDTNTCLVIAALALELRNARAAKAAYLLAALCPFTAVYTAAPLSETLAIFCTAHAVYYGTRGLKALQRGESVLLLWCLAGLWASAGIFMRPDNGIILPAMAIALLVLLLRSRRKQYVVLAGAIYVVASLAPLVPWTVRNWRVFHVRQPLASRYANDPGEFVPMGFNHWMKTWIVDFVSVEEVYWKVPDESVDPQNLPQRAFDTRPEYEKTQELIARYNDQLDIDPVLDAEFEAMAQSRVEHKRLRCVIWLPTLRMADMWLRPRTEMLNIETRWWEFRRHPEESWFAVIWAGVNLFYILAACAGWMKQRLGVAGIFLIGFVVFRTVFLSTLENPEPRYVLECFPVILALASLAFAGRNS